MRSLGGKCTDYWLNLVSRTHKNTLVQYPNEMFIQVNDKNLKTKRGKY